MDLDVGDILSEIVQSLLVECGKENVSIKNNNAILHGSKNESDSPDEDKLNDTEMAVLPQEYETSSDFHSTNQFKEEIEKNTNLGKLSDGYDATSSSSGFEDLSPKVNGTTKENNLYNCPAHNVSSTLSSRFIEIEKIPIKINRMLTSTPINFSNKIEKTNEGFVDEEISNDAEDLFLCEKDNEDYFDETIEKAINRYEKDEKKFNTVAIQTANLFEMCIKCCSSKSIQTLNEERDETSSPSKKKFKAMTKNTVKIKENIQKSIEIMEFDDEGERYECEGKEVNVNIVNKIPIIVTKGISTGGENFGFRKTPRIRVGLSKKIKPKKLSKH